MISTPIVSTMAIATALARCSRIALSPRAMHRAERPSSSRRRRWRRHRPSPAAAQRADAVVERRLYAPRKPRSAPRLARRGRGSGGRGPSAPIRTLSTTYVAVRRRILSSSAEISLMRRLRPAAAAAAVSAAERGRPAAWPSTAADLRSAAGRPSRGRCPLQTRGIDAGLGQRRLTSPRAPDRARPGTSPPVRRCRRRTVLVGASALEHLRRPAISDGDAHPDPAGVAQQLLQRPSRSSRPWSMIPTTSASCSTSSSRWPRSARSCRCWVSQRSVSRMATMPPGSRPLAGSSRSSRSGSDSIAAASPRRCFMPSE